MSKVTDCPRCGGKAKVITSKDEVSYQAIQNEDLIKKIGQLKKAMEKYKNRSESLAKELASLKSKN